MLKQSILALALGLSGAAFADDCDNFAGSWAGNFHIETSDGTHDFPTTSQNTRAGSKVVMEVTIELAEGVTKKEVHSGTCSDGVIKLNGPYPNYLNGSITGNHINFNDSGVDEQGFPEKVDWNLDKQG